MLNGASGRMFAVDIAVAGEEAARSTRANALHRERAFFILHSSVLDVRAVESSGV